MSIDTTRKVLAEYVEIDDELDLDGDEYGDNEFAVFGYALVSSCSLWYDAFTGEPMVTVYTSQGEFEFPAGHKLKVKVSD